MSFTYAEMLVKNTTTDNEGDEKQHVDVWNEDDVKPGSTHTESDITSKLKNLANDNHDEHQNEKYQNENQNEIRDESSVKPRHHGRRRDPTTTESESKYSKERFYSWNEFEHRRGLRLKDICTFTHAYDGIFLVESDFGKYEWSQKDNAMAPFNGTFLQWCYFRKVYDNFDCVGKRSIRDMCCVPDAPPVSIPKPPMSRRYGGRRRNNRRPNNPNNYGNNNNYGRGNHHRYNNNNERRNRYEDFPSLA